MRRPRIPLRELERRPVGCQACQATFDALSFREQLPPWVKLERALVAVIPLRHCGRWACFAAAVARDGDRWPPFAVYLRAKALAWALDRSEELVVPDPRYL